MKLFFLVAEDWYFHSHRLPMARAAKAAGYDVTVLTGVNRHRQAIEREGIRVIPFSIERRALNPISALRSLLQLTRIYRREKPDVAHHIAMKPVLLGSMAAALAGVPHVVNAFAGLGYMFTADAPLARGLRMVTVPMFRVMLKRRDSVLLLQNGDDRERLAALNMLPDRTVVIRGSGVDLAAFRPTPLPLASDDFICVFAGRMIDIKGLSVLKDAFNMMTRLHPSIKLWLCGEPDPANPGSWTEERLLQWSRENPNVVYKGRCDMTGIWPQSHLALQPSLGGEGIPKSLLEAAACGRPIVATDVPGCREVALNGVNGITVPPHDARALVGAITTLAGNAELSRTYAAQSRAVVEGDLSADGVAAQAEKLYRSLKPSVDNSHINRSPD